MWSFAFLHDNVHIVSGSEDGTMRKWDCETGLLVGEPWEGQGGTIYALALSPDRKTIACGRENGSVERWNTDGEMMEGIWTGHSKLVGSLSWSPSGGHIASSQDFGTILIRKAESGQDPIETMQRGVWNVAYSPLGDRIASGGWNSICIWDSHTGDLLVGPIEDLGDSLTSVVWPLDGTKLYSASDKFAHVFDSTSGTVLYRFQHDDYCVYSIALSPTHNVLACVGWNGVAQLWNTESRQPFGRSFHERNRNTLHHVSFSPDGQYLAYGGDDNKITLMSVKVMLPVPASSTNPQGDTRQEALLKSASSDVHSTNPLAQSAVDDIIDEIHDNPYNDFFASSKSSLPLPPSPKRCVLFPSPFHAARNESMSFHERIAPRFHLPRALSNSPLCVPAIGERTDQIRKGKWRAGSEDEDRDDVHCPANIAPGTTEPSNHNGKQREESIAHMQSSAPYHPSSSPQLDNDGNQALWKSLMRARKKDSRVAPAIVTQDHSRNVVEVYPIRVPEVFVVVEPSAPMDDSSIWYKLLDKLCYPRGHFHDDHDDA